MYEPLHVDQLHGETVYGIGVLELELPDHRQHAPGRGPHHRYLDHPAHKNQWTRTLCSRVHYLLPGPIEHAIKNHQVVYHGLIHT
jgi:hypothetical protein